MLVSRSTTIAENAETYRRLMNESGLTSVLITERNEDYGSVYVVYGNSDESLQPLAKFVARECRVERECGLLCN